MTARPILFSAPMVRALLEGRKTQTQRVIKPQPDQATSEFTSAEVSAAWQDGFIDVRCPYGQPGDLLWVRESFSDLTEELGQSWERYNPGKNLYEQGKKPFFWYRADGEQPDRGNGTAFDAPWKPSIHMPRWGSRITLEITDVRVQRLNEISEEDALAEGINHDFIKNIKDELDDQGMTCPDDLDSDWKVFWSPADDREDCLKYTAKDAYQTLWEDLHGPGSWDTNPWVWALTFKVHHCNIDAMQGAA
jgi:hypothetical protein